MKKLILKLKNKLDKTTIQFFIKFCVVGLGSTILSYTIFFLLYSIVSIHYIVASLIGYVSGLAFGYFLNKLWTFGVKKNSVALALKYITVYIFSLCLSIVILYIMVDYAKIDPLISNVFVIMISTLTNFFGVKIIVFNK